MRVFLTDKTALQVDMRDHIFSLDLLGKRAKHAEPRADGGRHLLLLNMSHHGTASHPTDTAAACGWLLPRGDGRAAERQCAGLHAARADGHNLRLHEQRGQVVLVNFWATWCAPCRQEMPHLNRLYDKYRASGFVLLGVNVDDDARKAAELAARLDVKFPVLLDSDKKVSRAYDASAMPSTVVIDRDGKVRYVHRGYRDGYEDIYERQIRELLKE